MHTSRGTDLIYHICSTSSWRVQEDNMYYVHASLATEGFIHCSTEQQIAGVLDRYFVGLTDLVQLTILPAKVGRLVYEATVNGEDFPHVYGPLPKSAILEIKKIR